MEENVSLAHDHAGYCLNSSLIKLPDHIFDGIVKYLPPRSYYNLKETSKVMVRKCAAFESSVSFWLDQIKIREDGTVQYYRKGELFDTDAFLATRFKLMINVIQVSNLGNAEALLLHKILGDKEVRCGQLYSKDGIFCTTKFFRQIITDYCIFKIVCNSIIPRLQTDIIMQRIAVFLCDNRQLLEWKNGFLLKNKIEILHIVGYFFTPLTIHKILKELIEDRRHINSWVLEKCYFEGHEPDNVIKSFYRGFKLINPEAEPNIINNSGYVVKTDDQYTHRLVSASGREYIVNINMGVVIDRKFPTRDEDEMEED